MLLPTNDRAIRRIPLLLALACFLLHFINNLAGAYGFFRDELYYIACSKHLAWGYVDQPPFSLAVLKISRLVFGDSLAAIRLVPSLAHAATVYLAGLIALEMGGRRLAAALAALLVLITPILLAMTSFYSMNSIDIVVWPLVLFLLLRIKNTGNQTYWIVLGVVLGLGLLNKISVLFLGAGIFAGLLFTDRQAFTTRWPYVAGIIAAVMFLPYVLWNMNNDMAHLEFIHNATTQKYGGRTRMDFLAEQVKYVSPLALPVWIGGVLALFLYKPLKPYRMAGWIFVTAFAILVINRTSKGEYLAPAYTGLFAGVAVWAEQKLTSKFTSWIKYAYPALLVLTVIATLPMTIPVIPVGQYIRYARALGMEPHSNEKKELSELPQFYADMFGWKEKARDVARVYNTLSDADKARCAIFSTNYGRCGAIDFFGEAYGLPKSIGSHNNYWIWGPRAYTGELMLILGGSLEDHTGNFDSVIEAGLSQCRYCMPYENNVRIFICRGLKPPLRDIWADEKHYE